MFCQTCGNEIIGNPTYCNRCGFRVSGALEKSERPMMMIPPAKPTGIVITLSIVTGLIVLTGLGMLIPLLIALLKSHVDVSAVAAITFMFLATLFGVSWLLIKQVSRALDVYLHGGNVSADNQNSPQHLPQQQSAQLFSRNTGQIEAPKHPFISVTEHTTKILDPAQQEKNR